MDLEITRITRLEASVSRGGLIDGRSFRPVVNQDLLNDYSEGSRSEVSAMKSDFYYTHSHPFYKQVQ